MFSGIVETTGTIYDIVSKGQNKDFIIESPISVEAYIDQSIAHNGVCLTVVEKWENKHRVTAIHETLLKSNLNHLKQGDVINLERSVTSDGRMDGHFVQGHTDTTLICNDIQTMDGSWYFSFLLPEAFSPLIVSKGSICINGVSLTLATVADDMFSVAIIPYTFNHTNFCNLKVGDYVNVEFDIIGKYIVSYLEKLNLSKGLKF
jgi:riboflavin synthase